MVSPSTKKTPSSKIPSASTSATGSSIDNDTTRRKNGGTGLNDLFIGIFGLGFLLSASMNILHATESIPHAQHETAIKTAIDEFKGKIGKKSKKSHQDNNNNKNKTHAHHHHHDHHHHEKEEGGGHHHDMELLEQHDADEHPAEIHFGDPVLSHLSCDKYGGPPDEFAQEMVYWADIPSDASFVSPFHTMTQESERKYMTFEPDGGGWNNIRMAMESVIGLAVAMGRTLVMPPQKKMYLLGKSDNSQRKHFSFVDFFPIEEIAEEHAGLDIVTMQEFLESQAMTGKMRDKVTGEVVFPPGNRTDWNGIEQKDYDLLRGYLRNVTNTPIWNPGQCLPAFPQSGDHKDVQVLQNIVHKIVKENKGKAKGFKLEDKFDGNPVPVDAHAHERLEENLAGRSKLCVYDEELQQATTLHFQCNHKLKVRMLVHFYAFLFFEDWKQDLWMKRFIRDHVHYIDEVQCAAARVVHAVREHARKRDPINNPNGIFDTFHIRRGDFQFKTTRIEASEIYENTKNELAPNSTIYVATDERNKKFFKNLAKHYDLVFMDDFKAELGDINTNYYGMIDQLIASRGRIFFGCFFSTFTGYINRIRGYHSQIDKAPGYEMGELPTTYYYATLDKKFIMHKYAPLKGGFFNREYPISWRELNKGIGMMHTTAT